MRRETPAVLCKQFFFAALGAGIPIYNRKAINMRSFPILISSLLLWSAQAFAANPVVEMKTSAGAMRIELYADKAPKSVENFLQYAKDGYYDGVVFHRVIDGFMIQGGGYDTDLKEKKGKRPAIENEAGNGLKNEVGTLAMARTSDPHSATAQFFINVANNGFLNYREATRRGYGYAVFGKVIQGMEVVMAIAHTPTGPGGPFAKDVPKQAVVIQSVTLITDK
jgi:peptidyl-prolyl cis-trans isomerase A (cyclophilin A)/peptidyl-prolyl cis-trans isomerase B (cyclophilin B)